MKAGGSTATNDILKMVKHSIRRGWWMDRADGKIAARAICKDMHKYPGPDMFR